MKAIIVDDERRTRKFFASVIDWNSLGVEAVLEAGDGEEAYALIREERPELLMIDMRMPRKDGVELLQLVRELPYPHKTIVVSGFDDYHYMKKTIEYGGFDYFTKPIDELEVTARLREAVRELAREKEAAARGEEAAKAYQEQRRLLRDSLMTQWIDRTALHSEIASQLAEEWGPGAGRPFSLCLCRTNEGAWRMERLYGERKDLFDYSLLNAAGELMRFPEHGTGFRYLTAPGTVLLALYGGPGDAAALCRELARRVDAVFGIRIEIAIAGGGSFPDDLGPAYARALSVWEGINQLAPEPGRVYERVPEVPSLLSLLDGERGLPDLLSFGRNDGELRRFAARLLADCREAGGLTNRQIRWWERELETFRELQLGARGARTAGSHGSPDSRDSLEADRRASVHSDLIGLLGRYGGVLLGEAGG